MSKNKQSFQWKKGEHYADVEIISKEFKDEDGDTFYIFESGRRINKNFIDEFMVKLENPNLPVLDKKENLPPELNEEKRIKSGSLTDYPTEDELQSKKSGEDKFNLGNADAIPHPDDVEKVREFNQKINSQKQEQPRPVKTNNISQGIPVDGESRKNQEIKNFNTTNQNQTNKTEFDIFKNAKKQTFKIRLTLETDLPVKSFFNTLDDKFIKKNKNAIIQELINEIKEKDLDKQLKENLIRIYNLNPEQKKKTQTTKKNEPKQQTKKTNSKNTGIDKKEDSGSK